MSNFESFDIQFDDGYVGCPLVGDFPEVMEHQIVGGNKQVTNLERIQITFDYPLSQSTIREFFKQGTITILIKSIDESAQKFGLVYNLV
jgi:hypothetical protein